MRSVEEIIAQCKAPGDVFGFRADALIPFLTFEQAKPLLMPETTAESWHSLPLTEESVEAEMQRYMEFAWGKVEDHRGISAERSIIKMMAWLWLLCDDKTMAAAEAADYPQYAAPKLAVICKRYGFPVPGEDWAVRMISGLPCKPKCTQGCGR